MKKFLALMLAVLMVLSLAACGGNTNDKVDESADAQAPKKVLKMATNAAFPPYEYTEGEKFVGIDIEIAEAIADELGMELEVVDMEFDSIITSVKQG